MGGAWGGVRGREAGGEDRPMIGVNGTPEPLLGALDAFEPRSHDERPGSGGADQGLKF